jgi:hypothetical protein
MKNDGYRLTGSSLSCQMLYFIKLIIITLQIFFPIKIYNMNKAWAMAMARQLDRSAVSSEIGRAATATRV